MLASAGLVACLAASPECQRALSRVRRRPSRLLASECRADPSPQIPTRDGVVAWLHVRHVLHGQLVFNSLHVPLARGQPRGSRIQGAGAASRHDTRGMHMPGLCMRWRRPIGPAGFSCFLAYPKYAAQARPGLAPTSWGGGQERRAGWRMRRKGSGSSAAVHQSGDQTAAAAPPSCLARHIFLALCCTPALLPAPRCCWLTSAVNGVRMIMSASMTSTNSSFTSFLASCRGREREGRAGRGPHRRATLTLFLESQVAGTHMQK